MRLFEGFLNTAALLSANAVIPLFKLQEKHRFSS